MDGGAEVEGLQATAAGVAVGVRRSDAAQQGAERRDRLADEDLGRVDDRLPDRLAAGHLAEALASLGVGDDRDVAGEERAVGAAQVEQHRVVPGDRDDVDPGDRAAHLELSVDAAAQAPGVVVADGGGEQRGRHVLVGDRTLEALDGEAADAGAARVGRRRVGTAVDHRVADLDTGRPAVEEHPAGLELEDRQERGRVLDVAVGGVDGRGELALEGLEAGQQGGHVVVPHHDAGGAEHLVGHGAVVDREQLGRCLVDHRRGGVLAGSGALADDADAVGAAQAGGAAGVGVGDAGGEHLLAGGAADRLAGRAQERVAPLAGRQEEQAGVGAELTGAERQAADVRLGERGDVALERAGQHDDGVDRRHLGVDRDRDLALGGGADEGEAPATRAGEADRGDARVDHELLAGLDATEDEGERAGGQAGLLDGAGDRAGDEGAGDRVGGVALHDDGAAGGERRGGVAARGGEGEREVAGPEDRDRAERHHPLTDVGARQGRTVRQRRVDAHAEVVALPDDAGEHPQLAGGAADLAGDPPLGQPALADRLRDDRVLVGLDLGRDRLQEGAPLLGGGGAVGGEGLDGCRGGGGDVGLLGVGASDDRGGEVRHGFLSLL